MDASCEVLYFQTLGLKLYNNLVLKYQTLSVVITYDKCIQTRNKTHRTFIIPSDEKHSCADPEDCWDSESPDQKSGGGEDELGCPYYPL